MKFDGGKTVCHFGKSLFLGVAGAWLLGGDLLSAQTYIWIGGNSGGWEAAENWDSDDSTYPNGPGVTVLFGDGGATTVNVNENGSPLLVGDLDFASDASAYTFSLLNTDLQFYGNGISNLSSHAVTFDLTSGSSLTFQGSSSAGGEIYHIGSGTLTFRGTSTAGAASITVGNGGTVEFDDISNTGTATFHLCGGSLATYGSGMSLDTGAVSGAGALVVGNLFSPSRLTLTGTADTAFSSAVLQSGTLIMDSSGTVTLGDFSADGASNLVFREGTVALTASGPSSASNMFTFDGGALCLSGGNFTFANTVTVDSSGTLILPHAQTASLGTLAGSGTLSVRFGTGAELNLGNGSAFTGTLSFDGPGTLDLSPGYQLGASARLALADGAALQTDPSNAVTDTHDIVLNAGGGVFRAPSPPATFTESGIISGPGGLTITGGTVSLSGDNTYSGGTTILSSGSATTLIMRNSDALGSASGTVTFAGDQTGTLEVDIPATLSQNFLFLGDGTLVRGLGTLTLEGLLDGPGNVTFHSSAFAGTLALNRAATYTGSTTIDSNFSTGAADVLKSSSGVTFVGVSTLTLNDHSQTFSNLRGSTGSIQLGSGTLTAAQSSRTAFSAGTLAGTGGVGVTGIGSLLLSGNLTYSGATTVNTTDGSLTDGLFLANSAASSAVHVIAGMLGTATYASRTGAAESLAFESLCLTRGTSQLGFALQGASLGDSFTLTNGLTLTGSGTIDLVLLDLSAGDLSGSYTLLTWGSGAAPVLADFSLDASSSPGFNAADLAIEGNSLVYLTAPEPGPIFLLLGGGLFLFLGKGRLKQSPQLFQL